MDQETEIALNEYHEYFEKHKNEISTKLETIKQSDISPTFKSWLDQAIQFIKEQKG